jgi:hypothetical protein
MKSDPLDRLLDDYARQLKPFSGGPSHADVWQAIEQRRGQSGWSRVASLLEWRELFGEPRVALAAAVFAIAVGVVPAAMVGRAENQRRLARQSIHFDVFTVQSGSLGAVFAKPGALTSSFER